MQAKAAGPPIWSWKVWGSWAAGMWVLYVIMLALKPPSETELPTLLLLVGLSGPSVATFYYGIYYLIKRQIYVTVDRRLATIAVAEKAERLQDELDANFFTNLVKINFKYLDKYYLQTQVQGDKSFLLCAGAALTGLLIIAVGITMMFFGHTQPAYVTTASGVLGEFISAVFFYLYNRTVLKMSEYHQKLVLTQNIALALKIAETLPDQERVKSQQDLIAALTVDVNRLLAHQLIERQEPR